MVPVRIWLIGFVLALPQVVADAPGPGNSTVERNEHEMIYRDVIFGRVDDVPLKLDLYLPLKATGNPPVVVYFHGGSWRSGSKESCQVRWLARHGYAVASVGYRKSHTARFPAILHDCKGAIRFLRANGKRLGITTEKLAVAGCSAGGHLALLLATTGGDAELEGKIGGNLEQSSRVQAALGMYCPTDLHFAATTDAGRWDKPASSLYQFLGGKPSEKLALARAASSTTHVTTDDPPIILLVGSEDTPERIMQGRLLRKAYEKAGLRATFQILAGAGHGGPEFRDEERVALILDLLKKELKGHP